MDHTTGKREFTGAELLQLVDKHTTAMGLYYVIDWPAIAAEVNELISGYGVPQGTPKKGSKRPSNRLINLG